MLIRNCISSLTSGSNESKLCIVVTNLHSWTRSGTKRFSWLQHVFETENQVVLDLQPATTKPLNNLLGGCSREGFQILRAYSLIWTVIPVSTTDMLSRPQLYILERSEWWSCFFVLFYFLMCVAFQSRSVLNFA